MPLLEVRDYDAAINTAREAASAVAATPNYDLSAELQALKPELVIAGNDWKVPESDRVEEWAVLTAVLPALINIVGYSVADEATGFTLLATSPTKVPRRCNSGIVRRLADSCPDANGPGLREA